VIEQATWTRHDNLRLATKLGYLATVRHTSINGNALQPSSWSKLLNNIVDLLSELTSWSEDECLGALLFRATQFLEDRENEGCRLSGSRLREPDKIPSFDNERNRFRLNWGWMGVTDRLDRLLKERSQGEIIKGKRTDLFRS
jgi:hypothetical protein